MTPSLNAKSVFLGVVLYLGLGVNLVIAPRSNAEESVQNDDQKTAHIGTIKMGKVLFLGNSITLHGPKADIAWTGNWGMAASVQDNDYVHILLSRIAEGTGAKPETLIKSMYEFERHYDTCDIDSDLKKQVEFKPDIIILAIGENVPALSGDQVTKFKSSVLKLLKALGDSGNPSIFVRSCFWPDKTKDEILRQASVESGAVFVDIKELSKDEANYARSERKYENTGVAAHPGDKGMAAIADAIWTAVKNRTAEKPPVVNLEIDGQPALPFLLASDFAAGKLRGFELGDANSPNQPKDSYFTDLAATGANLGRVWIRPRRGKGSGEYTLDDMQLRNMDYFVSKARANKIWIVFLITTNDEREGDLWSREELRRSLATIWKTVAARYKDVPEIAGFDLVNEPIAKKSGEDSATAAWFKLASDITSAIRSVDTKHVVIVEPSPGAEPVGFLNLEPIKDSNVVYSVHMYHPHDFTHQGVYKAYPRTGIEYPSQADSPIGAWDKARLSQDLEPVRKFTRQTGIPIYVGEFSSVRWAPNGSRERYASDLISLFEAEKWAWTYHQWRGWPGWDPENISTDSDILASKRNANSPAMDIFRSSFKANHQ